MITKFFSASDINAWSDGACFDHRSDAEDHARQYNNVVVAAEYAIVDSDIVADYRTDEGKRKQEQG